MADDRNGYALPRAMKFTRHTPDDIRRAHVAKQRRFTEAVQRLVTAEITPLKAALAKAVAKGPERGPRGRDGVPGERGLKGDKGAEGATGDAGLKGDTGERGADGERGSKIFASEVPPTNAREGDLWIKPSTTDLRQLSGRQWKLLFKMQGPRGRPGVSRVVVQKQQPASLSGEGPPDEEFNFG
jgi:hypothetical protein